MIALIIGTVFALGALTWVVLPLIVPNVSRRTPVAASERIETEDPAIHALRDIEIDRATGKPSAETSLK